MGQIKNIKLHIVTDIKKHSTMVNVPTSVQVFGRKKTATAVAFAKRGQGLIKVNGRPLDLVQPVTLRMKVQEPLMIIGKERVAAIDIRVSVKGGGQIAQIYAIRQAISKAIVAYYQKFVDEASKKEIMIFWCSTIVRCWWLIPDGVSRRSSVVQAPEQDTRSLTVKICSLILVMVEMLPEKKKKKKKS